MEISLSFEAELKNLFYTTGPYIPTFLQAVYEDSSDNIINIPLKLDLLNLYRNHRDISALLINEFNKFLKLLNNVVFEIVSEEISRSGSQYLRKKMETLSVSDLNCSLDFNDCLINCKNIKSLDVIDEIAKTNHGKLIYLKSCFVVDVAPPEVFLFKWTQKLSGCSCQGLVRKFKKNQSFIDALSGGRLKERSKSAIQICNVCDRMFQNYELSDQLYLNCQKVKIKLTKKDMKKQYLTLGDCMIQIYLNYDKINQLEVGNVVDLCCYFNTHRRVRMMSVNQKIKMQQNNILICINHYPHRSFPHFKFFERAEQISIDYSSCKSNQYLKLYNNYKEIILGINQIDFSFSHQKSFTLLKIAMMASVFLSHPMASQFTNASLNLSLLILTDEQNIVNRLIKLQHLNYKYFPTNYDSQSANLFLLGCHNSVLIFNNPNKKDFQYIEQAIRGEVGDKKNKIKVSITVWVVMDNLLKSKQFPLDVFDVIVDITFIQNVNNRQVSHQINQIVDVIMEGFCPKVEFSYTVSRGRKKFKDFNLETTMKNQNLSKSHKQNSNGLIFLEQYYIAAREHKKTNISNLLAMQKVAIGICVLRKMFTKDKSVGNVQFIDAIFSIFLDEETSRNKKGNSNTLLANEIAKFLLNQKDQMYVHEFVFRDDDFQEVNRMVHKSSVFIRIVDEIRRIVSHQSIA